MTNLASDEDIYRYIKDRYINRHIDRHINRYIDK